MGASNSSSTFIRNAIETEPAFPNEIGMHRVAFSVDDIDTTLAIVAKHGYYLLRGVATYEDIYKLTYLRGSSGILVMFAEELKPEPARPACLDRPQGRKTFRYRVPPAGDADGGGAVFG